MKTEKRELDNSAFFVEHNHKMEWLESEVHPDIIGTNVTSLSGNNAYERLLYGLDDSERINTGRLREKWLKRYDHLNHGGWWCSGVDLLTLKPSEWGCFKPQRPKIAKGKAIKYETPPNVPTSVFALEVKGEALDLFPCPKDKPFWEWAIENPVPITITEGAKKAGALLSQGHVAIALSGIYNFTDDGVLKPEIQKLIRPGREFVIAFDQDKRWHVRNNVTTAMKRLADQLQDAGCQVSVIKWDYEHGKGIDDFISIKGAGELAELFENRLEIEDYLEKYAQPHHCKRLDQFAKFLDTQIHNVEYNSLTDRVEWEGKPVELSGELQFKLLHEYNVIASEKFIISGLLYKAKQNAYHPVKRYLESLSGISPISIDNLSSRYFGTTDPFYDLLLKKWLIGAVARVFEPGCQFDNALILQGEQWAGKSQFFKILGGKWYDGSFGSNVESAKALMTLHRCWIQEWAEFDKVTGKNDFNAIKDFLTCQSDTFVRQYGRDSIEHPRMSVMGGSINPTAFLKDSTGDRRFWVIPLGKNWVVPTEQLREERDQIWAAAVQAYRQGESRYLTREQYEVHKKINEQFRDQDIWLSTIENWLIDRGCLRVSIERILIECLGFTLDKIDTKSRNRVRDVLIGLGCQALGSRRESEYDGKARRVWETPTKFPSQVSMDESDNGNNGDNGSDNGSVVNQNPDTARVTTVTTVNNGQNTTFLQLPKNNGTTAALSENNGSVVNQNPDTARVTTVTTVNNGNGNGKKQDRPTRFEPDRDYELKLIQIINGIFERLGWEGDRCDSLMLDKIGKTDLELMNQSQLLDLATILYREENKEELSVHKRTG